MAQTVCAERFPLIVPLRFRKSGTSYWLEGRTMNLSRTGILFKADEALPADSLLEIRVELYADSMLECHGYVVRTERSLIAVQMRHPNLCHQA